MPLDHTELIATLRERSQLPTVDPVSQQAMRDAAAALVRVAPPPALVDFVDTSSIPHEKTRRALVLAAFDHLEATGAADVMEPIPDTSPQLVVVIGRPLDIVNVLADHMGTNHC